jgi:hypothetical protein
MQKSFSQEDKKDGNILNIKQQKKALSKNQQSFNRLTARITNLRSEIEFTSARLVQLRGFYTSEINPLVEEFAKTKISLAKTLAEKCKIIKLTEKKQEEAAYVILDLLDEAFLVVAPDAEAEKLYNDISEISYQDAIREEQEELKEDLQDQLYDMFGIDIDMSDFDESPEGYAKFQDKIREKIGYQDKSKKKTKKQLEKEARLLQDEEVKKRSIRSIYMSLAKLLHPDTEMDETLKKEKEEVMKEITKAYNENDLSSLLKLELQWVAKETDHLEKLTDEKLQIYISVLKEQVKELEMEKAMQLNNPSFQPILRFLAMPENTALAHIRSAKKEYNYCINQLKNHIAALEGGKLRAAIRDCIEAFYTDDMVHDDDYSIEELMELISKKKSFKR